MKIKCRHFGISLTETVVVVASVAMLAFFGVPALNALIKSFESVSGTKSMISAAMASARAIAAKEQRYVGIRFQKANDAKGTLNASQYMVFIIHDPNLRDSSGYLVPNAGFRAIENIQQIKLPDSIGVMDLKLGVTDEVINDNGLIDDSFEVVDASTFSVVFAPSGRLIIRDVQVLRKNEYDTVFNDPNSLLVKPMFEDDYEISSPSLRQEPSRSKFIIYDRDRFRAQYEKKQAYSGYLEQLVREQMVHINSYTGTIIEKEN